MKRPGLLIVLSVLIFTLVIPTLIVVPYIQTGEERQQPVQTFAKPSEPLIKDNETKFSVSVLRQKTGQVETVPLELYVTRVVASEMPAEFELEAIKAQSLAARTYIIKHLTKLDSLIEGKAHVTDTIQHQVYKSDEELRAQWGPDYDWKINKIKTAVAETKGKILTYNNEPIEAAFFSTSNGFTENSEDYWENELPYLRSVESPWDEKSPKYLDQKVIAINQVGSLLGVNIGEPMLANLTRTDGNRVESLIIGGHKFTGRQVREALNLKSSDFTVTKKNNYLIFKTKGYGHGVGMSQYGANGMAQEGKSYDKILTHYYQGTQITTLNPYLPKLATTQ